MTQHYQPFYCEENAWWLCHELVHLEPYAVFISNRQKQCLLYQQRIAPPGEVAVWDYHVIVIADRPACVWDRDSRLPSPQPVQRYLDETFPVAPVPLVPDVLFRVVPAAVLASTFTTDRSHMRSHDGGWREPPPSWDPPAAPGHAMNLMRFVDMADHIAGEIMDLTGLRARFAYSR